MVKITAELMFEFSEIPTTAELDVWCRGKRLVLTELVCDMSSSHDWRYCFGVKKLTSLTDYETQERNANTPKEIIDRNMAVISDYLAREEKK